MYFPHMIGIDCSLVDHCWLLNTEQYASWDPSVHTVIFLKIPSMQFYLGTLAPQITKIDTFKKITILFLEAPFEGPLFLVARMFIFTRHRLTMDIFFVLAGGLM
jgi:hypothetical protein